MRQGRGIHRVKRRSARSALFFASLVPQLTPRHAAGSTNCASRNKAPAPLTAAAAAAAV